MYVFGPVQLYVAPEIVLAVSDKIFPEQTVLLLPAVGAEGGGLTVTVVVPAELAQPFAVAVTEYIPLAVTDADVIVGFCTEAVYVPGPVHEYVVPEIVLAARLRLLPAQTGELLLAVGATGV